MESELDGLFSPDGVEAFMKALGRQALYVEGADGKFGDLICWKTLNRLMAYGGLSHPRFRLTSGDKEVPEGDYWYRGRNGYSQLRVAEVNALLRDGSLLTIEAIEQLHEPISKLCGNLETALRVPVQADLYASWRDGLRRNPQRNDCETLLFQIDGRKSWALFQSTGYAPVGNPKRHERTDEPRWQGVLRPGELLYIPRGWWYDYRSLDVPALYLAVTFSNPRGIDMVWRIVDKARDKEIMMADVPRFVGLEQQSCFLTDMQREVCELAAQPGLLLGFLRDLEEVCEPRVEFNLPWSVSSSQSPPSEDHLVVPLIRFLTAETISRRLGFDDSVEVLHNGHLLKFDPEIREILDRLCAPPVPTVRVLLDECSNRTPRARVWTHLSELISRGLVSLSDPEETSRLQ